MKAKIPREHVAQIRSHTDPDDDYEITRDPVTGALHCACMSFRFARGKMGSPTKTCKHLLGLTGAITRAVGTVSPTDVVIQAQTSDDTYTITVRRGLRLGPRRSA